MNTAEHERPQTGIQVAICPLCGQENSAIEQKLSRRAIAAEWKSSFAIELTDIDGPPDSIYLRRCTNCNIGFFDPVWAADGAVYSQLQQFPWYYMPTKWEHRMALTDIRKFAGKKVLEIGCGAGDFIGAMVRQGLDAFGIELNEQAVRAGQAKGLPVSAGALEDLANQYPESFDVVCSFQVMEHVSNPRVVMENSIRLLRKGGRLIIAVPDCDGFIRLDPNDSLNRPPHHALWWSERAFRSMERLFQIRIAALRREPLAAYHLDWFLTLRRPKAQARKDETLVTFLRTKMWWQWVRLAKVSGLYKLWNGHTIYVMFQKA